MKLLSLAAVVAASFTLALFLLQSDEVAAGDGTPLTRTAQVARLARPADKPAGTAPAAERPVTQPEISTPQALYLVRATLMTLESANRTGNYSVLRDGASPNFQQRNSTADLAVIFAEVRRQGLELAPIAVVEPRFQKKPAVDPRGVLRLSGDFPSGAQNIAFDLAFRVVDRHWKLDGVSVGVAPARPIPPPAASTVRD